MQCPPGLLPNYRVFHSSKSARAWIRAVLDNPVRRSTLPYEVEFEKRGKFSGGRWPLPLVSDYNRVGGDMIVIVEIIVGRLMREALTRQGCQLVTMMLETNKGLPSGVTGCHLENTVSGKQRIIEVNCSIPINFFNKCREVGKRREIAMFGKSSIEDLVKFCLSLLLHIGIADHR